MSEDIKKNVVRPETGSDEYPGVAVDNADNDVVNQSLVDERTCDLNNNPRNTDGPGPSSQECH